VGLPGPLRAWGIASPCFPFLGCGGFGGSPLPRAFGLAFSVSLGGLSCLLLSFRFCRLCRAEPPSFALAPAPCLLAPRLSLAPLVGPSLLRGVRSGRVAPGALIAPSFPAPVPSPPPRRRPSASSCLAPVLRLAASSPAPVSLCLPLPVWRVAPSSSFPLPLSLPSAPAFAVPAGRPGPPAAPSPSAFPFSLWPSLAPAAGAPVSSPASDRGSTPLPDRAPLPTPASRKPAHATPAASARARRRRATAPRRTALNLQPTNTILRQLDRPIKVQSPCS